MAKSLADHLATMKKVDTSVLEQDLERQKAKNRDLRAQLETAMAVQKEAEANQKERWEVENQSFRA